MRMGQGHGVATREDVAMLGGWNRSEVVNNGGARNCRDKPVVSARNLSGRAGSLLTVYALLVLCDRIRLAIFRGCPSPLLRIDSRLRNYP